MTWEIANPIYQTEYSLNIFFYYYKNYHYYQTIGFKNVNVNDGYQVIYVNDSFFPNINETNIKWNYMVIIVGNNSDPDKEIKNVFSPFQRVNFYIYQNSTSLSFSTTSQTLYHLPTSTENIAKNEKSYVDYKIQTWKIIVISISLFILILLIIIIIITRKRRIFKRKLRESNFVEIIYQKPEIKEMEKEFLQKPNQF